MSGSDSKIVPLAKSDWIEKDIYIKGRGYIIYNNYIIYKYMISVPFTNLCQRITSCLPQARCLCSDNVAIGFKTSIEAYFVEKKQR